MFDSESEFKYYKLDSCCIALIVFLFFIERCRLTMTSDHDCTNCRLLHNKIPPTFAASNSKYFLTEFQKVGHPGVVLPGQRGSLWVSLESAVRLLAGGELQSGLGGPAHLCQAHMGLLAGGLISLPRCGPCSIEPQGCSQHDAHFPPARGEKK